MKILLTSPNGSDYKDIDEVIKNVVVQLGHILVTWGDIDAPKITYFEEGADLMLDRIDLMIALLVHNDVDTTKEMAYALGKKKPVLILCEKKDIDTVQPHFFSCIQIIFERNRMLETLSKPLSVVLEKDSIAKYLVKEKAEIKRKKEIKTVFVSYSHIDKDFLDRLSIHARPFEKEGLIDLWADTKINAGERWKDKISFALEKAAIAILLISADFLASDFIVDNELPPLLKSAEEKGTIILPVIVRPCRFTKNKMLSSFQSVNDPKLPLSQMDESEREEIYVRICDHIDSMIR